MQLARVVNVKELCNPHLVLTHVGSDDGLAAGELACGGNHMLHAEPALLGVGKGELLLPALAGLHPVGGVELIHHGDQLLQDQLGITAEEHIGLQNLALFGRVNVQVHLHGVLAEHFQLTGDAVVPAAADGENQVAVQHGLVGVHRTVHAEHPERKLVVGGEGAQAKHGAAHGSVQFFGQFTHLAAGSRKHGAVAHQKQGLLGLLQKFGGAFHSLDGSVGRNLVARQVHLVGEGGGAGAGGHVFGQVNQHGARSAAAGDVEGLFHNTGKVVGILHQVGMLDSSESHTAGVAFLEGVCTQVRRGGLGGQHHDGARIHKGGVDAGKGVGGARTAGHQGNAHFPGLAGIAVGHVGGSLLVAGQHYFNIRIENCVEHGDRRSTGISENGIDSLSFETLDNHFGTT